MMKILVIAISALTLSSVVLVSTADAARFGLSFGGPRKSVAKESGKAKSSNPGKGSSRGGGGHGGGGHGGGGNGGGGNGGGHRR
ncbi:hypothetical protein LXJ58_34040, partial [Escherichia coli]|nr:hypothetical protein [Escherichia coli]